MSLVVRFGVSAWCGTWAFCEAESLTVYFLFLNSFVPSISVTYSKPFSISCVASFRFVAVLQWYSSFSRVSSSWVYRSVVLKSLCPSRALTCSKSFVLWYSIVA